MQFRASSRAKCATGVLSSKHTPPFSLSPARTSGRESHCVPPATRLGTVDHVAERLHVLGIKWNVVCWCSEAAKPGHTGPGFLPGHVLGLMQKAGTRGTGLTVLNPGPLGICLIVSLSYKIQYSSKFFADYSDITNDDSRTKDRNGYWEKEVAELLGDLMPPIEVKTSPDSTIRLIVLLNVHTIISL